jgi:uncharacterized damage-inducible protein DinB
VTEPLPFPEPTEPAASRAEVFLRYLEFYRSTLVYKLESLPEDRLRATMLPSGWTPVELLKHLTFVELRWFEWGFEGRSIDQPWGDERDDRWYVPAEESLADLVAALRAQGERTAAIVAAHDLDAVGAPGPRWDGGEPPVLERVLLHVFQEYARHVGHLDIVVELAAGTIGE